MANNLVGVAHVLLAIGFEVAVERMNIMAAGISEFEDLDCFWTWTHKEIDRRYALGPGLSSS